MQNFKRSQPQPSLIRSEPGTSRGQPSSSRHTRLYRNFDFASDYDHENVQPFPVGGIFPDSKRGASRDYNIYPNMSFYRTDQFPSNHRKQNDQINNKYKRDRYKNKNTQQQPKKNLSSNTQVLPNEGPPNVSKTTFPQEVKSKEFVHKEKANYKLYKCPNCLLQFDCLKRNNSYVGRVPLILNCKHTVCQDCISKMARNDTVICSLCKEHSELPPGYSVSNLQDTFSPNFFMVGIILWRRSLGTNLNNISLAPAGDTDVFRQIKYSNPPPLSVQSSGKTCCFLTCNKDAAVQCTECNDFYCQECSVTVHKSAKSLWSHKQVPLEENTKKQESLEVQICTDHNMPIEYYCTTCELELCCYCFIEQHEGHPKENLLKLSDDEMIEFEADKNIARKLLKQLIISQKKLEDLSMCDTDPVEEEVTSYFVNLHAKLQDIERNLKKDIINSTQYDAMPKIKDLFFTITDSIEKLKSVVVACDKVGDRKINMRTLYSRLKEAKGTPCYLLSDMKLQKFEFHIQPEVDELESYFAINKTDGMNIQLVSEDDLPPDYEKDLDIQLQNDVENIISSLGKTTVSDRNKVKRSDSKSSAVKSLEQEQVEVTHIESLDCFYVQLKRTQNRFGQMNNEIKDYIKRAPTVDHPELNELYLVQVLKEKVWCRGRVTDIDNEEAEPLYEVFLIDYGSKCTLDKSGFREITISLSLKKPFAVHCQLYNPSVTSWSKNAHVYMAKLLNGRKVTMMVKSVHSGVHEVDLTILTSDRGQTSVIDYLIHACTNALSSDNESTVSQKFSITGPYKIYPNSVKFDKFQEEKVKIVNIIDPHHIYVHLTSHAEFLEKLNNTMNRTYKDNRKEACVPIEGTYVIIEYRDQIRGNWHRGLVNKVNTDTCQVLLVDWGLDVNVQWSNVRMLQEEFTRLETQAILVKLAHVEPIDKSKSWTDAATDYLQKFYDSQEELKMIVQNVQPLEVALFEMVGDVDICINAQLVQAKLVESTGKISQTLEWPKNNANFNGFTEDDGLVASLLKKIESCDESDEEQVDNIVKQKIDVVKLVSPDLIYIQFPAYESQKLKLNEELQIHYGKERKTKTSWKVDEQCVVFHNLSFARAIILEKVGEKKYKVNIYDRATEDVVSLEKIYEFNKYFSKFPNVVFKSHLANIKPAGGDKWSLSSIEALERIFDKYKDICAAKVEGEISGKSIPMNMWYTQVKIGGALEPSITKFISLNNLLVKMGFAYKTSPAVTSRSDASSVKSERSVKSNMSKTSSNTGNHNSFAAQEDEISDLQSNESLNSQLNSTQDSGMLQKLWSEIVEEEETLTRLKNETTDVHEPLEADIDDWLPPFRIREREFYAWIKCADPGGILYIREEKLQTAYEEMENKMKEYFDTNCSNPSFNDWQPGQLCTIHYDEKYYRGKVIEVNGEDDISVVMIDFGSDHKVSSKDLRQEILYPKIPAFASKIKLDRIYAKTGQWIDSDYQTLLDIVTEYSKIIINGPLDDEIPSAEVLTDKGINLNQLLVQLCANLTRKLTHATSQSEDDDDAIVIEDEAIVEDQQMHSDNSAQEKDVDDVLVENIPPIDTTKYKYKICPLPDDPEDKVEVTIMSVLEYNKVALKETSRFSEELVDLNNKIQKTVHLQPVIEHLEVGMPCVCLFSDDKLWYRAQVYNAEGLDCGFVFVFFVDFGNVQSVAVGEVKMMRPEWFSYPVSCHIADVNIKLVWDKNIEHVTHYMKTLASNQFAKIVTRDPLCVSLHDKNGALSYASLLDKKLVEIV